jgi:hypothetical protein
VLRHDALALVCEVVAQKKAKIAVVLNLVGRTINFRFGEFVVGGDGLVLGAPAGAGLRDAVGVERPSTSIGGPGQNKCDAYLGSAKSLLQ